MSFFYGKKIIQVLLFFLPLFLLIGGVKINAQRNEIRNLKGNIQKIEESSKTLHSDTLKIREDLDGSWGEIKRNTVSISDPITWCIDRIRGGVGVSDFDIEPIGANPPVEMRISRLLRNEREGLWPCLVPYKVNISFKETTLGSLLYVFEELESKKNSAIISKLSVEPLDKKETFRASAEVCFPVFYYPKDARDVKDFLSSDPSSLPK